MTIPAHVSEIVRESPNLGRSGGIRGSHIVMRYCDQGVVWKFRCRIPDSRQMVGEIRRATDGHLTVCCWQAADPGSYDEPLVIVARKAVRTESVALVDDGMLEYEEYRAPAPHNPILPPLSAPPAPAWTSECDA